MKKLFSTFCILVVPIVLAEAAQAGDEAKNAEYHIRLATDCYAKGQYDEAIKELDDAIRLEPKNALAFSCRGAVRFAQKDYDRSITDLNEAIRLEPAKPSSGYYIRGAAWYMKKDYAKGVKDLEEAIRLNPKDVEALNSRSWAAATCPEA
jgi:tetratricopeptide (TPR) repeat protein